MISLNQKHFLADSKINKTVNVISPAELADFEKLHHKIFKNITFEIGANITSKYENGQIWTHVWAWWTGEGKKSKKTTSIPVHLAFKWMVVLNQIKHISCLTLTFINSEIALNINYK